MGQIANDIDTILKTKDGQAEAESERQKILADMRRTNAEKANIVKKALAAQRAKYGAGAGGGTKGLSEDAVMKRLKEESEEPYDDKLRDAEEKISKIKTPKFNLLKTWIGRFAGNIG